MSSKTIAHLGIGLGAALIALFLGGSAWAQEVRWSMRGPLAAGQQATLELTFEDARPSGAVSLPDVDGLGVIGNPGQSTRIQMSQSGSGRAERIASFTLAYPVRAQREGRIDIPSFEVATDRGLLTVAPVRFEVGTAALPSSQAGGSVPLDEFVQAVLRPSDRRPYAGEVFDLDYIVLLGDGRRGELLGEPLWRDPRLVAEDWSEGRSVRVGDRSGIHFQTRAMIAEPGPATVVPVEQEVAIETGRSRRDPFGGSFDRLDSFFGSSGMGMPSIFDRKEKVRVVVATDALSLEVEPLSEPSPEGFTGAVGKFELTSRLVPENPREGEPVTWTLSLEGTGNWPAGVGLPARSVPEDFRTLTPHVEREFVEGDRFSGKLIEDLVMIPRRAGVYALDPVRFVYFDPETGRYETDTVEIDPIEVAMAKAGTTPALSAPPAEKDASIALTSATGAKARAADRVDKLPADIQAGSGDATRPLGLTWVAVGAAVPFAGFLALASVLGFRRARETDPQRERREAWATMDETIASVRSAPNRAHRVERLRAWQDASARFFEFEQAAPSVSQWKGFGAAPGSLLTLAPDEVEAWTKTWEASDRVLYGEEEDLEDGWCDRAESLFNALDRPRFSLRRMFAPGNLFPRGVVAAVLALLILPAGLARADGQKAYREGAFEVARAEFLKDVSQDPGNWVARYNLGLVESQLGLTGRAFAQTAAAFLGSPTDPSVRWNLALFDRELKAQGGTAPLLARVAFGDGFDALARQAAPFTWQLGVWVGAALFFTGSALALWQRHGFAPGNGRRWLARGLAAFGLLAFATSGAALAQYGTLLDSRAALVAESGILRSVPTDAEGSKAQRPIAAGTLVVQAGEFIGWMRVTLPSGESGWLRTERLVPLYADSAASGSSAG